MDFEFEVAGSGALNLDLIYEVENLDDVRKAGFNLAPGRELAGDHEDVSRLEKALSSCGRRISISGGGSAANTITALSAMGRSTTFLGFVGDDSYGEFILSSMGKVDLSMVEKKGITSVCVVIIDIENRDRAMFVAPGYCQGDFGKPEIKKLVSSCKSLHISSLAFEKGPDLQKPLLQHLGKDAFSFFDPGELYAVRGLKILRPFLERADILFITEEELDMLDIKVDECDNFPSWLSDNAVIVKKMGARGAMCINREKSFVRQALNIKRVVDNTGAGDAFNAGFINSFLENNALEICLEEGISTAALSLSGYGRHWIKEL